MATPVLPSREAMGPKVSDSGYIRATLETVLSQRELWLPQVQQLPDRLPVDKFRAWMNCAPQKLFQAIDQAVQSSR